MWSRTLTDTVQSGRQSSCPVPGRGEPGDFFHPFVIFWKVRLRRSGTAQDHGIRQTSFDGGPTEDVRSDWDPTSLPERELRESESTPTPLSFVSLFSYSVWYEVRSEVGPVRRNEKVRPKEWDISPVSNHITYNRQNTVVL